MFHHFLLSIPHRYSLKPSTCLPCTSQCKLCSVCKHTTLITIIIHVNVRLSSWLIVPTPAIRITKNGKYLSQSIAKNGKYLSQSIAKNGKYLSQSIAKNGNYLSQSIAKNGKYLSQIIAKNGSNMDAKSCIQWQKTLNKSCQLNN